MAGSLKNFNLLFFKLHNNPLAHQCTLCDFLIFNKERNVFAIEAKQITCVNGKGSFARGRLTQESYLELFNDFGDNLISLVCLLYYNKTIKSSYIYLIPIDTLIQTFVFLNKKSINLIDAKVLLSQYEVFYSKKCLDFSILELNWFKLYSFSYYWLKVLIID